MACVFCKMWQTFLSFFWWEFLDCSTVLSSPRLGSGLLSLHRHFVTCWPHTPITVLALTAGISLSGFLVQSCIRLVFAVHSSLGVLDQIFLTSLVHHFPLWTVRDCTMWIMGLPLKLMAFVSLLPHCQWSLSHQFSVEIPPPIPTSSYLLGLFHSVLVNFLLPLAPFPWALSSLFRNAKEALEEQVIRGMCLVRQRNHENMKCIFFQSSSTSCSYGGTCMFSKGTQAAYLVL